MKDWEINPDKYLKDEDNNFIFKVDGTPRLKGGRPKGSKGRGYNYHSQTKAKLTANRVIKDKQKKIAKTESKLHAYKESLKNTKQTIKKLENSDSDKIITPEELSNTPKQVQQAAKENVIFAPNEGPQTEFLAAAETDVLYGGAAGGGKSYAMLVDPLRYAHRAAHRALIIRRSMPELRELIDKSRELYPKAFPGCKYREVEKLWNFPSGAKIEFGFLERDADVYRYQGQAYSWIGFDEITHLPTNSLGTT